MSKSIRIRIWLVTIVLILAISCLAQFVWYQTNISEIVFGRCIDSVVEVKATTDDVGESYIA